MSPFFLNLLETIFLKEVNLKVTWRCNVMSDRFKVQKKITYNSGTFRITIPKMFIENLGLKEGDDVTLIYKDNKTLIITTEE